MSATPAPHPSLGQFRPGTPWDMLGDFSFKRKGFSWLSFYTLSVERQGNPPAKTHVLVHHSGRKDLSVLPAVFFFFLFFFSVTVNRSVLGWYMRAPFGVP